MLRLHRLALWLWAAYVAVTGAMLLWLWGPGSSGWHITGKCVAGVMNACSATGPGAGTYEYLLALTTGLITIVPAIAAAFAGGTLIGRELERGTASLAWTQSVPPARWLTTKLALPAAFLVVGTGILVALRHLVASAASGLPSNQWFTNGVYGALGPTAVALPLLGLALGALVAFISKRVIPSICVSLALLGIVITALGEIRGRLWPPSPSLATSTRATGASPASSSTRARSPAAARTSPTPCASTTRAASAGTTSRASTASSSPPPTSGRSSSSRPASSSP